MPRAHDYREAATRLRRLDRQLAHDWTVLRNAGDPTRIAGGPTRALIDDHLGAVDSEVLRARDELDRLARICDRRAEICAVYAADLVRHRHLLVSTGIWSAPPPPPAWWAEP
jgi:hypothetical protein